MENLEQTMDQTKQERCEKFIMDVQQRLKRKNNEIKKNTRKKLSLSCNSAKSKEKEACFEALSSTCKDLNETFKETMASFDKIIQLCVEKQTSSLVSSYNKVCTHIRDIAVICKLSQSRMLSCKEMIYSFPVKIDEDSDNEDFWLNDPYVKDEDKLLIPPEITEDAKENVPPPPKSPKDEIFDLEVIFNNDDTNPQPSLEPKDLQPSQKSPKEEIFDWLNLDHDDTNPQPTLEPKNLQLPQKSPKEEFFDWMPTLDEGESPKENLTTQQQIIDPQEAIPTQQITSPQQNMVPQETMASQQSISEDPTNPELVEVKIEDDNEAVSVCNTIQRFENGSVKSEILDIDIEENDIKFAEESKEEHRNSDFKIKSNGKNSNAFIDKEKIDDRAYLKFPSPQFIKDSLDDFDISNSNLHHLGERKGEDSNSEKSFRIILPQNYSQDRLEKDNSSETSFRINLPPNYNQEQLGEKESDKKPNEELNNHKCIPSPSSTYVSDNKPSEGLNQSKCIPSPPSTYVSDSKPSEGLNQSKCILSPSTTDVSDNEVIPGTSEHTANTQKVKKKRLLSLSSVDLSDRNDNRLTSNEIVAKYLSSLPEDRSTPDAIDEPTENDKLAENACKAEMTDNENNDTITDEDYDILKENSKNDIDAGNDSTKADEDSIIVDSSIEKRDDENKDKESHLPLIEASTDIGKPTPSDKSSCLPNIEDTPNDEPPADPDIDDFSDNENLLVPLVLTPDVENDLPDKEGDISLSVIEETPNIEETDETSDNENLLIPLVPANPENNIATEDENENDAETDKSSDNEEDLLMPIIEEVPVKENHTVLESKGEQGLPDPLDVVIDCSDIDDKSSEGDLLIPLVNGVDSSSDNENKDETIEGTDIENLAKIEFSSDSDMSRLFRDTDSDFSRDSRASLRRKCKKSRELLNKSYKELIQECRTRRCRVIIVRNKIYEDENMKHLKLKSEIKRLFNMSSLNKRRRSDSSITSSCSPIPSKQRTKKSKLLVDSSDSDSLMEELSSSGTIPYDYHQEMGDMKKFNAEDMDDNDIFNNIRDSDSDNSSIKEDDDDDDDIDENKKVEKAKENDDNNKKDKNTTESVLHQVSSWRRDPLLTRIQFSSDSESDEAKQEKKQKKDEERLEEKMKTIFKEENYFSVDSFDTNTGDDSSDCAFVSFTKKKRKRKNKSDAESDEVEINEEDDDDDAVMLVDDGSPKKGGRKNIRAVKSAQKLERSTKLAAIEEKEHELRLEEKRKKMDEVLTQSGLSQDSGLFLDASEDSIIEVNANLGKRLKTHQVSGVQFMWDACYESVKTMQEHPGSGCILAHCMGLGKTFQVITLIHTLFKHPITNTKHVLIVCPISIVKNWKNEFNIAKETAQDDTKIDVKIISGINKELRTRIQVVTQWRASGGVLVMGYETFICLTKDHDKEDKEIPLRNAVMEALVDPGPDLIVCDEGHQLKNNKTMRTKALMKIKTRRRIILTGTPLQNNLSEYYHMVQFVKPNLLGTYKEYTNRFVNPISNGQYDDSNLIDIMLMKKRSHVLHSILSNTIQRYEVSELEIYLPLKLDFVLFVPLHPIQAVLYKQCIEIFKTNDKHNKLFGHFNILQAIWTHPATLHYKDQAKLREKKPKLNENQDELNVGWWKPLVPEDCLTNVNYGPKFKIMLAIIKECEKTDDKLLIFSSYITELNAIEDFLKYDDSKWKVGVNYLRMDGMVAPDQRQEYCNQFNKKKSQVRLFLLTHKVGGLGLNLAAANRVILMDVCWNPSYDSQSIFRAYRFGQNKLCFVYRLVSMGTMEEVIYERSVTKQAIAGRVVDEMQITRHYKSHEVSSMYRCNVDITEERPCPKVPEDDVLAGLLQDLKEDIFKYHEHEALLRNLPDEELDKEQAKIAWEEYNKEKEFAMNQAANSIYNPAGLQSFVPRPILNDINNIPTTSTNYHVHQQRQQDNPVIIKIGSKIVTAAPNNVAITNKTPIHHTPEFLKNANAYINRLYPPMNALTPNSNRPKPRILMNNQPANLPKKWVVRPPGSPRRKLPSQNVQVSPLRLEKVIDLDQLDMLKKIDKNTDVTLTTLISDATPSTSVTAPHPKDPKKKNDIIEID